MVAAFTSFSPLQDFSCFVARVLHDPLCVRAEEGGIQWVGALATTHVLACRPVISAVIVVHSKSTQTLLLPKHFTCLAPTCTSPVHVDYEAGCMAQSASLFVAAQSLTCLHCDGLRVSLCENVVQLQA